MNWSTKKVGRCWKTMANNKQELRITNYQLRITIINTAFEDSPTTLNIIVAMHILTRTYDDRKSIQATPTYTTENKHVAYTNTTSKGHAWQK